MTAEPRPRSIAVVGGMHDGMVLTTAQEVVAVVVVTLTPEGRYRGSSSLTDPAGTDREVLAEILDDIANQTRTKGARP